MPDYRVYILDADGEVARRIDLLCEDDDAARQHARKLVDGRAVELWAGTRFIEQLSPQH